MSTVGGWLQQHLPCQDELAAAKKGRKLVPGTCFSSRTQKQIPSNFLGTHKKKTKPKQNQFPTCEWLGIAPGSSFPTGQRKCSPLSYSEKATLKSSFSGFDQGNVVFLNRGGVKSVAFLWTQGSWRKWSVTMCFGHLIWAFAEGPNSSNSRFQCFHITPTQNGVKEELIIQQLGARKSIKTSQSFWLWEMRSIWYEDLMKGIAVFMLLWRCAKSFNAARLSPS